MQTTRTDLKSFGKAAGKSRWARGFATVAVALAMATTPALAQHSGGGHGGGGGHVGGAAHGAVHAGVGGFHGGYGFRGGYGYRGGWCCGWGWGPGFAGFGFFYDPWLAWPYVGLAAWELADYDAMTEDEIRAQQNAMVQATTAPVNAPIVWNQGNASGEVTPIRDGHTADGRNCREFQQHVTISGQSQQAYGTACQQADGSWQIVGQGNSPTP
jgi:hypothetical protein